MPAKTYNSFTKPVDGICFLLISSQPDVDTKECIRLMVDEKFWLQLNSQKWYWDRKALRAFCNFEDWSTGTVMYLGKKYLQRYIMELEYGTDGKMFMADPCDFRVSRMLHREVNYMHYNLSKKP